MEAAGFALMSRVIAVLAVTTCAFTLGCGASEGSSEGMVWHLVRCQVDETAKSEEIEGKFRGLASETPGVERFEWGRIDSSSSPSYRDTHWLLITFGDIQKAANAEYREAIYELRQDYLREQCMLGMPVEFVVHDATPHARTATRGHLRRAVMFRVKKEATPTEIEGLEDAMHQLPSEIPAIERLQWGRVSLNSVSPSDKSAGRRASFLLLLTFKDASARDECLAHPSYKELESALEQHSIDKPFAAEYIAR